MISRIVRVVGPDRPRVARLNDGSLEYVIFGARTLSVVAVLALVLCVVYYIWTLDGRWAATGGVMFVVTLLSGWFGWAYCRNAEWTDGDS